MGYIPDKYYAQLAKILEVNEAYLRGTTDNPCITGPPSAAPWEENDPQRTNPLLKISASLGLPRRHSDAIMQQPDLLPPRTVDIHFAPYPDDTDSSAQEKIDVERLTSKALKIAHAFDTSDQKTQEIIMKILDIEE